jgi:hypothetical protein
MLARWSRLVIIPEQGRTLTYAGERLRVITELARFAIIEMTVPARFLDRTVGGPSARLRRAMAPCRRVSRLRCQRRTV